MSRSAIAIVRCVTTICQDDGLTRASADPAIGSFARRSGRQRFGASVRLATSAGGLSTVRW